jgi:hypothetical protein
VQCDAVGFAVLLKTVDLLKTVMLLETVMFLALGQIEDVVPLLHM